MILSLYNISIAQVILPATLPNNSHSILNSGNSTTSNTPGPIGSFDNNWQVSTGGPYVFAKIINPNLGPGTAASCNASANQTNTSSGNPPATQWISSPSYNCFGGNCGNFGCNGWASNTPVNTSFRNTFNLSGQTYNGTNVVYGLELLLFSRGWIDKILVNGTTVYNYTLANIPLNYNPSGLATNGWWFRCCQFWKPGSNTIEIFVKSLVRNDPACDWTGLQVQSWGFPNGYPTITGATTLTPASATMCANTTSMFTVPVQSALNAPAWALYNWIKPFGFAGGSTSNSINITAGPLSVAGALAVNLQSVTTLSSGFKNVHCYAIAAHSITVPQFTVTPTKTVACANTPVNLSAGFANVGAGPASYTWITMTGGVSTTVQTGTNPNLTVNFNTLGNSIVTVLGSPVNGCIYTRVITINIIPSPLINAVASATSVCAGQTINFTAFGNALPGSYSWTLGLWPGTGPTYSFNVPTTLTQSFVLTTLLSGKGPNGCISTVPATFVALPNPTVAVTTNSSLICPGQSATLSASGASTYAWAPIIANTNTVVVSPTLQTTYSVVGTHTNGCKQTAVTTISILAHPTVVVNPPLICPGLTNTFVATGAVNYTWTVVMGGITTIYNTPTFTLAPTGPLSYTLCGSAPGLPCTACTNSILTFGPTIPLIAQNVTLCTNAGPNTTLVASSTLNVPTSYTWSAGPFVSNPISSSVVVNPTSSQNYTVSASSTSACPAFTIIKVNVFSNCCAQPTNCLSQLPQGVLQGTFANQSFLLDQNVLVQGVSQFKDAEFWITPGIKITVDQTAQLDLSHVHLFACGINMWEGIDVLDGGRVTSDIFNSRKESSLIEDAHIAINLDNISLTNSQPNPPIDIQRIIFNRNFIGIKVSNSDPNLNHLDLGISGCVFSSRQMTFNTCFSGLPLNWPSADWLCMSPFNGLRCPNNPTTGLTPPYTFPGFMQSNLKQPYNNQHGHIGIKIDSIGGEMGGPIPNFASNMSYYGVEFGDNMTSVSLHDFNLFDGLGVGIDVKDANLVTRGNVFQNMKRLTNSSGNAFGGQGIRHEVTDIINRQLALTPMLTGAPMPVIEDGNHFWNCNTGILAHNVYELDNNYSIFRSTRSTSLPISLNPMPGDTGISYHTNRFYLAVQEGQFNNVNTGIALVTEPTGTVPYSIGAGAITGVGICADAVYMYHNYFGALPTSATPFRAVPNREYMSEAVVLESPNTSSWFNLPVGFGSGSHKINIFSNKVDRAYRGININGMWDMPAAVMHNSVNIEDDYTFNGGSTNPAFGFGIAVQNKLSNVSVNNNTLTGQYSLANSTNSVSLIYCNFIPNGGASVACNFVSQSRYGFEFNNWCDQTDWSGNRMCDNWAGLALTNNGVIGQQGMPNPGNSCGNGWSSSCSSQWGSGITPFYTYVDNSDANQSPLFCLNSSIVWYPTTHASSGGSSIPYNNATNINNPSPPLTNFDGDCWQNNPLANTYPAWRASNNVGFTELNEENETKDVAVIPNPTNGRITIFKQKETDILNVSLFDISGKSISIIGEDKFDKYMMNLCVLAEGIYILEVRINNQTTVHKKVIKTN